MTPAEFKAFLENAGLHPAQDRFADGFTPPPPIGTVQRPSFARRLPTLNRDTYGLLVRCLYEGKAVPERSAALVVAARLTRLADTCARHFKATPALPKGSRSSGTLSPTNHDYRRTQSGPQAAQGPLRPIAALKSETKTGPAFAHVRERPYRRT